MWRLRYLCGGLLLGLGLSQSVYNAYGLGMDLPFNDVAALGVASVGLVPSFQSQVSLGNPATWNQLQFTLSSASYSGQRIIRQPGQVINEGSGLEKFLFIVPLNQKYAWGLGVAPHTTQRFSLLGLEEEWILPQDSLRIRKQIVGSGGVSRLFTALTWPLSSQETLALAGDFYHGSARDEYRLVVNQTEYFLSRRKIYSGILLRIDLNSRRASLWERPLDIYLHLSREVKPLQVRQLSYHPRQVGILPDTLIVDTTRFNAPYPFRHLGLGFQLVLEPTLRLTGEGVIGWHPSRAAESPSVLREHLDQQTHFSVGLLKFARQRPVEWYQFLHYRLGFYRRGYRFASRSGSLNEVGVSGGIGLKFGITGNQIDLSFGYGKRGLPDSSDREIIHRFSVGVSLGDRWFLKRRNR